MCSMTNGGTMQCNLQLADCLEEALYMRKPLISLMLHHVRGFFAQSCVVHGAKGKTS